MSDNFGVQKRNAISRVQSCWWSGDRAKGKDRWRVLHSRDGEHGVGTEKANFMNLLFSEADLDLMRSLREVWNPDGLCNPSKVFPTGQGCGEKGSLGSVAAGAGAWI